MLRLAAALLALAAPTLAWAYETVPTAEYPSAAHLARGGTVERVLLPDLDSEALRGASYAETAEDGAPAGLLTLRADVDGYASLLHYQPAGECQILRQAQPIMARQSITLTFPLPARGGLTRLLFWDGPPERRTLLRLAQYPNHTTVPARGVVAQRWYSRERPTAQGLLPWQEPAFELQEFGPRLRLTDWPLVAARLGTDLRVSAKDCAVEYRGIERLESTPLGIRAVWVLSPLDELLLHFELSADNQPARAVLLLNSAPQGLEVRVNGMLASPSLSLLAGGQGHPPAWDVGRLLRTGDNSIELRAAAFAPETAVSRIELWSGI